MSGLVALTLLAVLVAVVRRRADPVVSVETLTIDAAVALVLASIVGVGLAVFGWFDATALALALATVAAVLWPWRASKRWRPRLDVRGLLVACALVGGGLALRWPTAEYALAGRDQGTYTLRAQQLVRTGRYDLVDPVVAAAARDAPTRPGPADILGLYPVRHDAWAKDRYEGAYRPGLYLADRERGAVVPQFFHLHPTAMAIGALAGLSVSAVVPVWAALAWLAVWAVARRLWPKGPWALIATALVLVAPLSIWVQRTALTEVPATALLWVAVLAVLRDDPRDREAAALLLGAGAWLRGHGWIVAPIVAAMLWRVPPGDRTSRRASWIYVAIVVGGVFAHAGSIWPYLHDELGRQLPGDLHPGPGVMVVAAIAGALAWWAIDELWGARRAVRAPWRFGPLALVVAFVGAIAWWGLHRAGAAPFSRLDPVVPLVGAVWAGTAAVGLARLAVRSPRPGPREAWLLAIAAAIVTTTWLYAQRNLPQVGLYYYGRYLAPELLVVAALSATEGVRTVARVAGARRRWAAVVATAHTVALFVAVAGVLVRAPVTRIAEFAGAEAMLAHLGARLPPGAVVVAGGEGWHYGHTFNQVGGALALREGVTVLPYRTREAAYATLYELLVARPAATGEPAPPVFLLVNEATKPYRPDDGGPVAGLDDGLWPPFSARRVDLVELYVDRLTPVTDAVPTRVTRDGLRMGLIEVFVDPERAGEAWSWPLMGEAALRLAVTPQPSVAGPVCLRADAATTIDLSGVAPRDDAGAVSLVLVAAPGTAALNHTWSIDVDGQALSAALPHAQDRERDTIGPFLVDAWPRRVAVRGSPKKVRGAECPHGGVAEVRVLGPERAALRHAPSEALTFAPTADLGHPIEPARWVSARALSRFRAGISPTPTIAALSLRIGPAQPVRFPAQARPDEGRSPLDLVVTLSSAASTTEGDQLRIDTPGTRRVTPTPAERTRTWQSDVLPIPADHDTMAITIELDAASSQATIDLRDIGLFSRSEPIRGRRAP